MPDHLRYLAHMRQAPSSVRLIAAADKLHNVRSVLSDYRTPGEERLDALVAELDRAVSELERLTRSGKMDFRAEAQQTWSIRADETRNVCSARGFSGVRLKAQEMPRSER